MKIERYHSVTNGRLNDSEFFQEDLNRFEGKRFKMIMTNDAVSTYPQKKYFFGVVFKYISEFNNARGMFFTPEQYYDAYKHRGYFGYKEDAFGEPIPKGLREATTLEASEAKEKIQREWAEKGLIIPDPEQKDFLDET